MKRKIYKDIEKSELENYTGIIVYDRNSDLAETAYGIDYMIDGKLHRLDGPARIFDNPYEENWYYQDKRVFVNSQEEFESWLKVIAFE